MEREISTLNTRLACGWWFVRDNARPVDSVIVWEAPVSDMPYGRAVFACFMIFGYLILVRSTPVEEGVSKSQKEDKPGGDLRSLHFPTEYHATGVYYFPQVTSANRLKFGTVRLMTRAESITTMYEGDATINGVQCTKWSYNVTVYERNNSYVFYATKTNPPKPVYFEMNGYDTLLVSYYDKYVIRYHSFEEWDYDPDDDPDVFGIPHLHHDKWCWNIDKRSRDSDGASMSLNPMGEFALLRHEEDPVDEDFHNFRKKHKREYKDKMEHQKRKHIFRHNLRYIRSTNMKGNAYHLNVNHFADMTDDEFDSHKGLMLGDGGYGSRDFDDMDDDRDNRDERRDKIKRKSRYGHVPEELDWRKYGAVLPPKGQGTCGSCWAFAAAGSVEGANFIKTGKLVDVSEQQLLDCTWATPGVTHGNNGCLGGWTWKAFAWIKKFGIASAESYGPYRGQEGYCKTEGLKVGAKIHSYRRVKRYNTEAVKKALAYHGPATISINANPKTLKFYSHGVLDDITCNNKTDHAVLLIGYGTENGIPYWLIKNSWSHNWGNNGFIKIRHGLCGVEKRPFVVLNKGRKDVAMATRRKSKQRKGKAVKEKLTRTNKS
ncbi:hypothetical protein OS493_001053 [Desmophyllum pertusum]|uniref:Uncharacterized protein n=1 Tax=Desmophyllum pertusum TaxID=174260 RepID=A0A9W9ZTT1_9CNID|nr:hypothetical protein OS493_001053 [Desmophyllum pertusum]